jgi:dienelactone hydrolase
VAPSGRKHIGFTLHTLFDASRRDTANHPRVIQVAIWYPALAPGRHPVTYSDYLRIAAAETTIVDTAALGQKAVDDYRGFLVSRGVPGDAADAWLHAPMQAYRDAPHHSYLSPLVLIAQGNGQSAADQAVLAEYLASYGYVVVTSPSQARITGKPSNDSEVAEAIRDQFEDVNLVDGYGRRRHDVRDGRVALIGHSFGARSILLFAMRERTVRAVVSLDGGIGTATAREQFEGLQEFIPAIRMAPVLHIYEEMDQQMTPDWGTLQKLTGTQVWIAGTTDLHHHHFTSLGAASARFSEIGKATGASAGTGSQYAATLELTRAFLDIAMRDDSTVMKKIAKQPGALTPRKLEKS